MDGIKTISIKDKEYPESLEKIKNPPKVLYYRGSLPRAEARGFAIVGTRRYSPYGKQVALSVAGDLAESGITIVSGLAPGIDTFCHEAALERKGKTIAVLGTGIDEESIYPKSNLRLAKKIIETGGCLISEYPPGTRGTKFTFPKRNRIISGLSIGVLVIEAKEMSGALITANYAFSQGREVFAIPGLIHSLNSRGCHALIKKGAKLVDNVNDILEKLSLPYLTSDIKQKNGETKEEDLILEALSGESLYIDKIIEQTSLPASAISSTLAILEIKKRVRNLGGGIYALAH